jgi:hypothetical protein
MEYHVIEELELEIERLRKELNKVKYLLSQKAMDRLAELDEELEANHNNQKYRVTDGE